jgi:ubiquinone/menaquinone biosynthesis C-methylase UbiE
VALPVFGRVLSPDPEAYRYLVASMERFATRAEFEAGCRAAGFAAVRGVTLFPGVCGLVLAEKGDA